MTNHYLKTILLSVLISVAVFAVGCSQDRNGAHAIRLGYLQSDLHHLPVFAAFEKGFFEEEGLLVNVGGIFRAGPEEMSAFAAGELDVGYVGLAPAATAALNGVADITILAQVNIEGSAIVCRSDTASIAQLRGKTIAIPGHATMQDCLMRKGMRSVGLTPDMLRLMVLKPPEMLQTLTAGNIDCFIAWEPYPAQAVTTGRGSVVARSSELWQAHPCCVLIAQSSFAKDRQEDAAAMIRVHRKACRFIEDNPAEALAIAVKYTGMSKDVIAEAMKHMRYAPDIDRKKAAEFADFLAELNYASPGLTQKQLTFFNEK
jgi:NitT/TauT family transport system substrate-binding protein